MSTPLTERVELVKEHDAGAVPAGELEQVMQVAFTASDPHVEYVDQRDADELRAQLAGDRTGQERLATTRRSVQQQPAAQALGEQPLQFGVAHRCEERCLQPGLHIGHTAHVGKPYGGTLDVEDGSRRVGDGVGVGVVGVGVVGVGRVGSGSRSVSARGEPSESTNIRGTTPSSSLSAWAQSNWVEGVRPVLLLRVLLCGAVFGARTSACAGSASDGWIGVRRGRRGMAGRSRAPSRLGPRESRLAFECCCRMSDRLDRIAVGQQQVGQMTSQEYVIRRGVDRLAEACDQGRPVHGSSPQVCSWRMSTARTARSEGLGRGGGPGAAASAEKKSRLPLPAWGLGSGSAWLGCRWSGLGSWLWM